MLLMAPDPHSPDTSDASSRRHVTSSPVSRINPSHGLGDLIAFVESSVGGSVINLPRRFSGGIASEVYAMTCLVDGRELRLAVRRYISDLPFEPGPPTIEGEAATLVQLEGLGVPAPRLLGCDPSGDVAGRPTLVMTRLRGRLALQPTDPTAWTEALAEMLVAVHALPVEAPPYEPWPGILEVPSWAHRPDLWRAALELLASKPPTEPTGLVHGDYQQFNVLWRSGRISGVLDWTGSWVGPPDADTAHARLNLVCLYGVERAEGFRRAYESRAGRSTSAWRDVAEFVRYTPRFALTLRHQIARRISLDTQGMTTRVEDLLRLSLDRA
jgi:aminoglycoside phosphotransferase (APT) family kinase protein